MRRRLLFSAAALALGVIAAPSARAEIGASGTRMSVAGGTPRFYMTYGHADDVELYAPIVQELRRLDITFEQRGDDYVVLHRGVKVATWPIIRSREDVPDTGENPCVLVMGGNVYVPLRQLEELLPVSVKWDTKSNLVSVNQGTPKRRPPVAQAPQPAVVPGLPPAGRAPQAGSAGVSAAPALDSNITLTGVELVPNGSALQVKVRATAPIRPTWLYLKNPPRIVLDFPGARWADGVQPPTAAGEVKNARLGHFTATTARLALDVNTPALKLTDLKVQTEEVVASIGLGREVAKADLAPADEAAQRKILEIRRRNKKPGTQMASRQGTSSIGFGGLEPFRPRPTIENIGTSLTGRVICVDAGHGGKSAGAKGLDHLEKDLCLKMARMLRDALVARGATVIMTRDDDSYVSLEQRCQIANGRNSDLFISIHCNSMPRRNTASGSETYYHTEQSLRLAQSLHPRLVGSVAGRDGGIRNRRFYVVRNTAMPSVLLEIAYINNTTDEQLLARPDFHLSLGESLADGVIDYFNAG